MPIQPSQSVNKQLTCVIKVLSIATLIAGITDYIKGGYLMRRAWKLYDKCYCEISAIGGPFLSWAPELRCNKNGTLDTGLDDVQEALDEVLF